MADRFADFNPRARVGRDHRPPAAAARLVTFQSTRPRGARRVKNFCPPLIDEFQSTRPVWGATHHSSPSTHSRLDFNPRAPCGARPDLDFATLKPKLFQSTRPVWGATVEVRIFVAIPEFQSTRPVWGATLCHKLSPPWRQFQSTRPVWGATPFIEIANRQLKISIHTPRVGRDVSCSFGGSAVL